MNESYGRKSFLEWAPLTPARLRRFSTDLKKYVQSASRLRRYHNMHAGGRCIIIGNGPSLHQTDLSLLKNEVTFGLNRIYLFFPKMGFPTTYLVTINRLLAEQCAHELVATPSMLFASWYLRDYIPFTERVVFFRPGFRKRFSANPIVTGVWEGSTVTFVAMQLAYYMGFSKVILVGVDHHFTTEGTAHKEVLSDGDDRDHFDPSYFGKGMRWNLPDLATSEVAYGMARRQFESDGRTILDATVGGKLTVFQKAPLIEALKDSSQQIRS